MRKRLTVDKKISLVKNFIYAGGALSLAASVIVLICTVIIICFLVYLNSLDSQGGGESGQILNITSKTMITLDVIFITLSLEGIILSLLLIYKKNLSDTTVFIFSILLILNVSIIGGIFSIIGASISLFDKDVKKEKEI